MEFTILGPLEVRQSGRSLPCKGAKQRLLLAALVLHANEVVSSDRLIDALWGEDPPATAPKALQMHISQLRKLLAAGAGDGILLTRPPGYELRLDRDQVDLRRPEARVTAPATARRVGRCGGGHGRSMRRARRSSDSSRR